MAVYLTGITFPNSHVSADDDGVLYKACITDGILNGCNVVRDGAQTIGVNAGRLVASGKEIENTAHSEISVSLAQNTSGYVRLKLVINLDHSPVCDFAVDYSTSDSITAFPALTKGDLYMGDRVYEMPLAIFHYEAQMLNAQPSWYSHYARGRARTQSRVLQPSDWSDANNTLTVWDQRCYPGETVICSYDPSCREAWLDSGVYLKEVNTGVLVFGCDTIPSVNLTANLIWL